MRAAEECAVKRLLTEEDGIPQHQYTPFWIAASSISRVCYRSCELFAGCYYCIMGPKRKADSSDGSASKKRKAITIEVKLDIVKRYEKGETPTNIGRSLGFSRSTVATIIKDKDRILDHVKGSAPMQGTVITKQRSGLIIEMERLLVLWLEDQHQPK